MCLKDLSLGACPFISTPKPIISTILVLWSVLPPLHTILAIPFPISQKSKQTFGNINILLYLCHHDTKILQKMSCKASSLSLANPWFPWPKTRSRTRRPSPITSLNSKGLTWTSPWWTAVLSMPSSSTWSRLQAWSRNQNRPWCPPSTSSCASQGQYSYRPCAFL